MWNIYSTSGFQGPSNAFCFVSFAKKNQAEPDLGLDEFVILK